MITEWTSNSFPVGTQVRLVDRFDQNISFTGTVVAPDITHYGPMAPEKLWINPDASDIVTELWGYDPGAMHGWKSYDITAIGPTPPVAEKPVTITWSGHTFEYVEGIENAKVIAQFLKKYVGDTVKLTCTISEDIDF